MHLTNKTHIQSINMPLSTKFVRVDFYKFKWIPSTKKYELYEDEIYLESLLYDNVNLMQIISKLFKWGTEAALVFREFVLFHNCIINFCAILVSLHTFINKLSLNTFFFTSMFFLWQTEKLNADKYIYCLWICN